MRAMRMVAAALVLATVSAGCAGLPDSGPVERVAAPGTRTHSTVRYEPAGPRVGATPQQIVNGYLDAMLAYPESTGIVQSFLSPKAVDDWQWNAGMAVYSRIEPSLVSTSGDTAEVDLNWREALTIDGNGRATPVAADRDRTLRLERVGGEWRVANPVSGYLVSQRFSDSYLRSYPLWFFDESGEHLVPELVHAIVSEQLPLVLTRLSAGGPRLSTLRTFVPRAEEFKVRVSGKIVEVDLDQPLGSAREKFVAQLLSTLRGVSGIDGLRILVDGVVDGDVHPIDAVVGFGPGPSSTHVYALRNNRVFDVTTARQQPISGPWGRSARGAAVVAVDSNSVAAVTKDRDALLIGGRKGGAPMRLEASDAADPMWDADGRLWAADNPGPARVRVVVGPDVQPVITPDLGVVRSFAVSPDASRYAAGIETGDGASVVVGAIVHDSGGLPIRLLPPSVVSRGLVGERSVGWASQTRVEFLAGEEGQQQLRAVGIDGADLATGAALQGGIEAWAGPAVDGADRWAIDAEGHVWQRASGGAWRQLGTGTFDGLAAGR